MSESDTNLFMVCICVSLYDIGSLIHEEYSLGLISSASSASSSSRSGLVQMRFSPDQEWNEVCFRPTVLFADNVSKIDV